MRNTSERESFSLSWELPHAPQKVWRALTESDLLEKWVMPNDLKPVVGHAFTFRQQPTAWWDGIVYGEVLEVVPEQRLSYTWKSNRREDGTFVLNTTVVWTLSPRSAGGTLLRLVQSGFTPENGPAFAGAKSGWDRNVQRMIKCLQQ